MSQQPYVPYSSSVEVKRDDEEAVGKAIVASIARSNSKTFTLYGHALRQAHAKSHGALKGELVVYPDLPEHLRQGAFALPRTYPVLVRFSTAPGAIYSDCVPANFGMAIKMFGVEGAKADPSDGSRNQDLLLVNSPIYFADPAAYLKAQRLIERTIGAPGLALQAINLFGRGVKAALTAVGVAPPMLLVAVSAAPVNILGETYHSMAPLRYGAYLGKLRARPLSQSVRALTGAAPVNEPDALRRQIETFFERQAAEYELCVQLAVDPARTPVENASVEWKDALAPPQPIAKLVLPVQQAGGADRRVFVDEAMSFTPWRCLEAHRPLGGVMRLRLMAYRESARFRHMTNAARQTEPARIEDVPD